MLALCLASGDYVMLDAMQTDLTRQELGDINREFYDKLRHTEASPNRRDAEAGRRL